MTASVAIGALTRVRLFVRFMVLLSIMMNIHIFGLPASFVDA